MFLKTRDLSIDLTSVKAVIFDMDGTLVESEHVWAEAKKQTVNSHVKTISDKELEKFTGRAVADFIDEIFVTEKPSEKDVIKHEIYAQALNNYYLKVRVIPNAINILNKFASVGIRIAICSSGPLEAIQQSLEALKSSHLVELITSGDELDHGKPHPLPYQITLEKLQVEPIEALVFEDTISGVKSANAAGIPIVYVGRNALEARLVESVQTSSPLNNIDLALK